MTVVGSPELDKVLDDARREAGLSSFGATDFLKPLELWLEAGRSAPMTDDGRAAHHRLTRRCLVNRLQVMDEGFHQRPQIEELVDIASAWFATLENEGGGGEPA